jgi:predicted dehydrogenase
MSRRIRWGVLSTGHMAGKFVSDLRLVPEAELVAVGSRTLPAAEAFADRHGIPRAYGSWQALADSPDVDVVYVACPTSCHDTATLACLRAGRPVLTEKPFALDLARAETMVAAACAAGLFLMEAMWMRCLPVIRAVAALVADGAIGEVTAVSADFGLPGPFGADHRMRRHDLGGGALLDLGVYPVALAQLLLGSPDRVAAMARIAPEGADEVTAVVLGHGSGALATLTCSLIGHTRNTASIVGTDGRIELPRDFFRPQAYTLVRGSRAPEQVAMPHDGFGYQFEIAEVHRCLREGLPESPLVPLAATLSVAETLDAIRADFVR